jgi:hypothetical protein
VTTPCSSTSTTSPTRQLGMLGVGLRSKRR